MTATPPLGGSRAAETSITVAEALRLPSLREARIHAGASGLQRHIRAVNVMEDANIVRWMRGGELLLSTGYSVRDDPSALLRLLPALDGRQLAGLAIKLGLYVEELSPEIRDLADRLGFPLIGLPAMVMFHDVLAEILGTILNRQAVELARSAEIHHRLTEVALEGGSFGELVQTVSELVQRPVAIVDAQGRKLAATPNLMPDPSSAVARHPIMLGGQGHGEVVVWLGTQVELKPHELKTIEHAATIAAMAIAQERAVASSEQRHRALLLMQLVTRRTVDRAELARWATAMGWEMDLERAVVLVELNDKDGRVRVAGQPLEERLLQAVRAGFGSTTMVWCLRSGLALLLEPKPSLQARCQQLYRMLARTCPGTGVMVAAGTTAADLSQLGDSWQNALATLTLGRELSGPDFVLEYEELGLYRLLSRLPSEELRRHRDEVLSGLIAYDAAHTGSLIETLNVFLRCERNRVRASQELFVHYNTLRYRLSQIDRLTNGLAADPMGRLSLEVALCAHRLLQGRGEAT